MAGLPIDIDVVCLPVARDMSWQEVFIYYTATIMPQAQTSALVQIGVKQLSNPGLKGTWGRGLRGSRSDVTAQTRVLEFQARLISQSGKTTRLRREA